MSCIRSPSCYCFLNWVRLYFRTITPCNPKRKEKGPRRWWWCQRNRRLPLTAVKMPWQQRNCIVQQHHLCFFCIFLLSLLFPFLNVPVQPWILSPAYHSCGSLEWGARREVYFCKRGGEKVRRKVRFHEAKASTESMFSSWTDSGCKCTESAFSWCNMNVFEFVPSCLLWRQKVPKFKMF